MQKGTNFGRDEALNDRRRQADRLDGPDVYTRVILYFRALMLDRMSVEGALHNSLVGQLARSEGGEPWAPPRNWVQPQPKLWWIVVWKCVFFDYVCVSCGSV